MSAEPQSRREADGLDFGLNVVDRMNISVCGSSFPKPHLHGSEGCTSLRVKGMGEKTAVDVSTFLEDRKQVVADSAQRARLKDKGLHWEVIKAKQFSPQKLMKGLGLKASASTEVRGERWSENRG